MSSRLRPGNVLGLQFYRSLRLGDRFVELATLSRYRRRRSRYVLARLAASAGLISSASRCGSASDPRSSSHRGAISASLWRAQRSLRDSERVTASESGDVSKPLTPIMTLIRSINGVQAAASRSNSRRSPTAKSGGSPPDAVAGRRHPSMLRRPGVRNPPRLLPSTKARARPPRRALQPLLMSSSPRCRDRRSGGRAGSTKIPRARESLARTFSLRDR